MATETLQRILPLTPTEQAMVYNVEHQEHVTLAQVLAYLHWSKARGCALDTPYQQAMLVGLVERGE